MRKNAVRRATRGGVIALLTATVMASTAADDSKATSLAEGPKIVSSSQYTQEGGADPQPAWLDAGGS